MNNVCLFIDHPMNKYILTMEKQCGWMKKNLKPDWDTSLNDPSAKVDRSDWNQKEFFLVSFLPLNNDRERKQQRRQRQQERPKLIGLFSKS